MSLRSYRGRLASVLASAAFAVAGSREVVDAGTANVIPFAPTEVEMKAAANKPTPTPGPTSTPAPTAAPAPAAGAQGDAAEWQKYLPNGGTMGGFGGRGAAGGMPFGGGAANPMGNVPGVGAAKDKIVSGGKAIGGFFTGMLNIGAAGKGAHVLLTEKVAEALKAGPVAVAFSNSPQETETVRGNLSKATANTTLIVVDISNEIYADAFEDTLEQHEALGSPVTQIYVTSAAAPVTTVNGAMADLTGLLAVPRAETTQKAGRAPGAARRRGGAAPHP